MTERCQWSLLGVGQCKLEEGHGNDHDYELAPVAPLPAVEGKKKPMPCLNTYCSKVLFHDGECDFVVEPKLTPSTPCAQEEDNGADELNVALGYDDMESLPVEAKEKDRDLEELAGLLADSGLVPVFNEIKIEPKPTPSAPAAKLPFCPWERCKTDGECRFPAECSANDSYIEHLENQLKPQPDSSSISSEQTAQEVSALKSLLAKALEGMDTYYEESHPELVNEIKTYIGAAAKGSTDPNAELAWLEARWKSALVEGKDDYACALQVAIEALKASEPKKEM